ncbi:hypothetical protein [Roseixanthobacter pseudopolyaromaticivorans]|uniref:hypothetical protein n=1 Tax=Xanthobacteraceae TaxID=335928 RepID=UPI003726F0C2
MHRLNTSFVLGYHGCEQAVADQLLAGNPFTPSTNAYDWLGHGIYFWESNPQRGLEFARERPGRASAASAPAVVGAVIDLGYCLDLQSSTGIAAISAAYGDYLDYSERSGSKVPQNRGGEDSLMRDLDCAVLNHLHAVRAAGKLEPFDTVRAVFLEGKPLYPKSGFREKTHIQLCVRNPSCIKGVFRVGVAWA